MAYGALSFFLSLLLVSSLAGASSRNGALVKIFNVLSYGAVADGVTDNSRFFQRAWNDACHWRGRSRVLVPPGKYMVGSVSFEGPCNGFMSFVLRGYLKAPAHPSSFYSDSWIGFRYIDGLAVKGGGYLDGQGSFAWPYNDCYRNPRCQPLPTSLRFDFVNNSWIHHIKLIDSKNVHMNLFECHYMNISNVRITAPDDSPNTDGIHIGSSSHINIYRSTIGTGDDCIAMVSGTRNVDISGVDCGPGHGISIGSLGKSYNEDHVENISIRNCSLHDTQNGLRIKTWAPSSPTLAYGFTFDNVFMRNVSNPIIIDQQYCPSGNCDSAAHSAVQIEDVTFKNIRGTSNSQVAVTIKCSGLFPCRNVNLVNINLSYNGPRGPASSLCSNVEGRSYGWRSPPACL